MGEHEQSCSDVDEGDPHHELTDGGNPSAVSRREPETLHTNTDEQKYPDYPKHDARQDELHDIHQGESPCMARILSGIT